MLELNQVDIGIIAGYFLLIFAVAILFTYHQKVKKNSATYFLGGRNTGWFVIGASLFASNIGSEHLIGLAGAGLTSGVSVAQFEIFAGLILLLLGWVFVPFYLKSGVFTMPEFLEIRYSKNTRTYLSIISIFAYVLTKVSVTIAAGGIIFQSIGIDFWLGSTLIVVATGLYTTLGGLRAVLYTDVIQMFVFIGSAALITVSGIYYIGGWGELVNSTQDGFFELWKPLSHPDFPWTGILFGAPILGVWYWCTDQYIVQRVLAAKNIDQARKGSIFGGFLKILPLFIFVIPGIISLSLHQKGTLVLQNPDQALPALTQILLPPGVRGIVVAGLLAALMSSLSSVINSSSTLFTLDIYKKFKPETSEKQLVRIGQISTVVIIILGLIWTQYMGRISKQLFTYLQSVQAYISPPITAVFLFGIFFKRLNSKGAMASLLTGFVLGLMRIAGELFKDNLKGNLFYLSNINFLHFAILLFVLCSAILIIVSLFTQEPNYERIKPVTYQKTKLFYHKEDIAISLVLLCLIATLWMYFN